MDHHVGVDPGQALGSPQSQVVYWDACLPGQLELWDLGLLTFTFHLGDHPGAMLRGLRFSHNSSMFVELEPVPWTETGLAMPRLRLLLSQIVHNLSWQIHVIQVGMPQDLLDCDSFVRIEHQHPLHQVSPLLADLVHQTVECFRHIIHFYPYLLKSFVPLFPVPKVSQHLTHLVQLINGAAPSEDLHPVVQLQHHTTQSEHIHWKSVWHLQDKLRCPVPPCGDVLSVGEGVGGLAEAEVDELEESGVPLEHQIFGFDVAMHHVVGVELVEGEGCLEDVAFDGVLRQFLSSGFEILVVLDQCGMLQFEDQTDLAVLDHHFEELDDVGVRAGTQGCDFGSDFVLDLGEGVGVLLDGYEAVPFEVVAPIDFAKAPSTDLLDHAVLNHISSQIQVTILIALG